jgi:hypothetical protein
MSGRPSPLKSPDWAAGMAVGVGDVTTSALTGADPVAAATNSTIAAVAHLLVSAVRIGVPFLFRPMAAAARRVEPTNRGRCYPRHGRRDRDGDPHADRNHHGAEAGGGGEDADLCGLVRREDAGRCRAATAAAPDSSGRAKALCTDEQPVYAWPHEHRYAWRIDRSPSAIALVRGVVGQPPGG